MIQLPHPFVLAPIAECTTPAFRKAVRKFCSQTLICSEMLSAGAVVRGGMHNTSLMKKYDFDDPFIYQILGNDPACMAEAVRILTHYNPYAIDINMGCSAPDIIRKGSGSILLDNFELATSMIRQCRKATAGTLSVKLRSGYTHTDRKKLLNFTTMLQDEGIDFITLHPRHGKLGFKRKADWQLISFLKEHLSIPVIGNGDVTSAHTALRRLHDTGCDGIMIARQALTEPWIFTLCNLLYTQNTTDITINIKETGLEILSDIAVMLPDHLHKSRGHRFCFYYSKNMKFGHDLFSKIRQATTIQAMIQHIETYFLRHPEEETITYHT